MQVVLTYALVDGVDTALGSQVKRNDDDIVTVVNGNIEDDNVKVGADIQGSKLAGLSVAASRISDLTLVMVKHSNRSIGGLKMRRDNTTDVVGGAVGEGANVSELFSQAGDGGITNVMANRLQAGGGTLWFYFTIASHPLTLTIDTTVDWRERILNVTGFMRASVGGGGKAYLPGGGSEAQIQASLYDTLGASDNYRFGGTLYSQAGAVTLWCENNEGAPGIFTLQANAGDGSLEAISHASGNYAEDVVMRIEYSPRLETP
jgi:hypothetical protein